MVNLYNLANKRLNNKGLIIIIIIQIYCGYPRSMFSDQDNLALGEFCFFFFIQTFVIQSNRVFATSVIYFNISNPVKAHQQKLLLTAAARDWAQSALLKHSHLDVSLSAFLSEAFNWQKQRFAMIRKGFLSPTFFSSKSSST